MFSLFVKNVARASFIDQYFFHQYGQSLVSKVGMESTLSLACLADRHSQCASHDGVMLEVDYYSIFIFESILRN